MNKKAIYTIFCLGIVSTQLFGPQKLPVKGASILDELIAEKKPAISSKPYVPLYEQYVIAGKLVFISGQLPHAGIKSLIMGKVGESITQEEAKKAASLCGQEILAQLKKAVFGNFQKVKRCVKLTGFVNATPDFIHHADIIDGASEVIINQFGERGKHAQVAVGASSLPSDAVVEVEAIFELW
jgi:enamine deaminase RidA (YjgF/YER057c/UK114 family)